MRQIFYVCGLAAAILTLSVNTAHAQTTAVGPYYATPSWDQTLACTAVATCPRFIVLSNFNNDAVLDRETGLVWERHPSPNVALNNAYLCSTNVIGNRQGWRLPTSAELRSLIDPSQATPFNFSDPFAPGTVAALPPGHPFIGVLFGSNDFYWTTTPVDVLNAFEVVSFGRPLSPGAAPANDSFMKTWCVRGS